MTSVLIVEDQPELTLVIGEALAGSGFAIAGMAISETDACSLASAAQPDIAVVDVQLKSGGSGLNIGPILARRGVAVLYATSDPDEVVDSHAAGIGCLAKPYTVSQLVRSVRLVQEAAAHGTRTRPAPANFRYL